MYRPPTPWPGMSMDEWRRRTQHRQPGWQPPWTKADEERLKDRVRRIAQREKRQ